MEGILRLFEKVVSRNNQIFQESQKLVQGFVAGKDFNQAFECGKFLFETTPVRPKLALQLGQYHTKLGQFDEAITHFRMYARSNPFDAHSYFNMAVCMIKSGEKERGINLLRFILGITAANDPLHLQIQKMVGK